MPSHRPRKSRAKRKDTSNKPPPRNEANLSDHIKTVSAASSKTYHDGGTSDGTPASSNVTPSGSNAPSVTNYASTSGNMESTSNDISTVSGETSSASDNGASTSQDTGSGGKRVGMTNSSNSSDVVNFVQHVNDPKTDTTLRQTTSSARATIAIEPSFYQCYDRDCEIAKAYAVEDHVQTEEEKLEMEENFLLAYCVVKSMLRDEKAHKERLQRKQHAQSFLQLRQLAVQARFAGGSNSGTAVRNLNKALGAICERHKSGIQRATMAIEGNSPGPTPTSVSITTTTASSPPVTLANPLRHASMVSTSSSAGHCCNQPGLCDHAKLNISMPPLAVAAGSTKTTASIYGSRSTTSTAPFLRFFTGDTPVDLPPAINEEWFGMSAAYTSNEPSERQSLPEAVALEKGVGKRLSSMLSDKPMISKKSSTSSIDGNEIASLMAEPQHAPIPFVSDGKELSSFVNHVSLPSLSVDGSEGSGGLVQHSAPAGSLFNWPSGPNSAASSIGGGLSNPTEMSKPFSFNIAAPGSGYTQDKRHSFYGSSSMSHLNIFEHGTAETRMMSSSGRFSGSHSDGYQLKSLPLFAELCHGVGVISPIIPPIAVNTDQSVAKKPRKGCKTASNTEKSVDMTPKQKQDSENEKAAGSKRVCGQSSGKRNIAEIYGETSAETPSAPGGVKKPRKRASRKAAKKEAAPEKK